MIERFRKIDYGEEYAITDNQTNGLPIIRLKYSDDCCILVEFLNKQEKRIDDLKLDLELHKHPLWSTREAEKKVAKLIDLLEQEVIKNNSLLTENNSLKIENMRLKELRNMRLEGLEKNG